MAPAQAATLLTSHVVCSAGESPGEGIAWLERDGEGLVGWLILRWGRLRDLGSGDEAWELRGKQLSVALSKVSQKGRSLPYGGMQIHLREGR